MNPIENKPTIPVLEPWEREVLEGLTQPLPPEEGGYHFVLPSPCVYGLGTHSYDKHPWPKGKGLPTLEKRGLIKRTGQEIVVHNLFTLGTTSGPLEWTITRKGANLLGKRLLTKRNARYYLAKKNLSSLESRGILTNDL